MTCSANRDRQRPGPLNRQESSTEIIFAAGEGCQLAALPRGFEFRADPFFRRFHFAGSQSVFLERVIRRDHFHGTQRHDFAFKQESNVLPLRRLFEPVTQPPASLSDGKSLHSLLVVHAHSLARPLSPSPAQEKTMTSHSLSPPLLVAAFFAMTIPFAILWSQFVTDRLYNCTDDVGFGYFTPFGHKCPGLVAYGLMA